MATKKQEAPKAGAPDKGLEISSRGESFWRAELKFTREKRVISLADITPEQEAMLRAEGDGGQLIVTEVDIPAAKA